MNLLNREPEPMTVEKNTEKRITLVIHDLKADEFGKLYTGSREDLVVISDEKPISPCMGCFSCWTKTPGLCVIPDAFQNIGSLFSKAKEIVLISRCVYGGFSPFVKNALDRTVPSLLPFFKIDTDKMMHHQHRSKNRPVLSLNFYGETGSGEKETAEKLGRANALNFNAVSYSVYFYGSAKEAVKAGICA
ncbi:MAG: NAD(P)H-dependent oxidoreductase [Treponema sp.]|jgi:multimeric flavodoxin WrbA|nr:NAD(P)H-dependent oxidoreductase [Treponema sp.]